ncbi:11130_t:CDS:10 [Ambispora gerdemannii]|uniref:11130_t:CDS:1 n=1 Tax=Ambispora gerdemannii TaxID=144530 RepID=A0A9N9ADU9_9GLOM|nr:11130_t:CDS:10 [Ambispora gerdemannii]
MLRHESRSRAQSLSETPAFQNYILYFNDATNVSPEIYHSQYGSFRAWIDNSLDAYKLELRALLFPVFVHVYLDLVAKGFQAEAAHLMETYKSDHLEFHSSQINKISVITHPHHVQENETAQIFRNNKYNLRLSDTVLGLCMNYLQENKFNVLLRIINQYLNVKTETGHQLNTSLPELDQANGISGHTFDELEQFNKQKVYLGSRPMDSQLREEIETVLKEEGSPQAIHFVDPMPSPSLLQEHNQRISREQSYEGSERGDIPFPPHADNGAFSKGVDVQAEIAALNDIRNRITLGPTSTLPSICFYTFHNSYDSLNCLSISKDASLIAGGFAESYIKIWSLNGEKIKGLRSNIKANYVNGTTFDLERFREKEGSEFKRLTGHSGPVFGLSFSPDRRYLVSCSEDKTARLWSTDTYTNLVCYKGHNYSIWDIDFCPLGFYFATASHDRTARLWSCDQIFQLRIFAGHLSDVDTVKFHPNARYIFTGSSDRTVRMWDIQEGETVRVFSGHTGTIYSLAISDDGKLLASAGEDKTIKIWDLGSGKCIKTMKGHQRIIYSLDFSKERSILVSGSADSTVRVWDVNKGITTDINDNPETLISRINMEDSSTVNPVNERAKHAEENLHSDDLISTFPTKRTPVYKVLFTPRNLCLGAGAFVAGDL